jgi:leucyl aminopeptidase
VLRIGFAGGPPPDGVALARFGTAFDGMHQGRRVVSLASPGPGDVAALHDAGAAIAAALMGGKRAVVDAIALPAAAAAAIAAGACLRAGRYSLRTRPEEAPWRLSRLTLHVADPHAAEAVWQAIGPGIGGALLAQRLGAEPPNLLTPKRFAERLGALRGVDIDVLKPGELRRHGFGALLGVARGSASPPRVVVMQRKGAFAAKPLVLVGKGVTFDTGGISIKPADDMEEMKTDMAGAAAIAGCMQALAARDSPAPVIAVLGLVENMPGAAAQRPGDVVRAVDGSTIEIIDTDAEGRLVLADCLAWARRKFSPVAMVDLATLTGSILVALGGRRAGLFASNAALGAAIAAAGAQTGEQVWPMPLDAAHAEPLQSAIADVRHCVPERFQPDACQAAAFLHRFAGDTPWAHLDIAGMEWRREPDDPWPAGATGFGARLLDRLVASRFEDPDNWPDAGH